MKTLLIAATAGLAMFGTQVRADHSTLPPRGQELFGHRQMVSGPTTAISVAPIGPAAKAPTSRETMASGTASADPNLVRAQAGYTGRNPFASQREFEIAPLGKGKECAPNCTKPCCAKK